MNKDIEKLLVRENTDIKQAMKQIDLTEKKILFVVEDGMKLIGTLTDGDIRRWILGEGSLKEVVEKICNRSPVIVREDYSIDQVKKTMLERNFSCIPVVNGKKQIVTLLFWEDVFKNSVARKTLEQINLPVVIMAGGEGTRLDPFTKILPKPLIPIGDKTVLEMVIETFLNYGIKSFYLSVNYKSKIIKSYFEELNPPYSIEYIYEEKPLGTAGSLKYLEGKINNSLIVTNCDTIIHTDFSELVNFHYKNKYDITMVASLKNYNIPYGICEIENGGALTKITEKPEYNFLVNTGMYVLETKTLKLIPENECFHIIQFIEKIKENGGKVGVFPISEDSWIDTGEWTEYKKALTKFSQPGK